ncbi:MAG TPA: transglycosylase SLT domain-containing protein [Methylomirabilota bacterium]|nr:transglycosylase SLT domain-containing protein [Methylomirabilota bacterium]
MRRWLVVLTVGIAITGAAPGSAETPGAPAAPDYSREIGAAARRYAVPERLVWAIIRAESGFDPRAVSGKGARGLMQLMPETAAILGVRNCFDPHQNIDGGVRHLRALLERFRHDPRMAVAAYNAGEKAVADYGGVPPYPETREYVARVMRFYGAPVRFIELPGGIRRIVERDGTIVYTNIPPADGGRQAGG